MLLGFLAIIVFQLIGEIIVDLTNVPIPASIIGMILMLCALILYKGVPKPIEDASNGLIKYFGLLFVPAGAGVSMYLNLIQAQWHLFLIATLISTIVTFILCGGLYQILAKDAGETSE